MPRESRTRAEWSFALKGTLSSYLRPGSIRQVSLQQVDGLKRRVQASYGVTDRKIKEAIAACIESSPNCDSARADEIRRKYLN
jgi:hypothetical protein